MEVTLEPFEKRLRGVIASKQVGGPVRTRVIAETVKQPIRTVRHYLRNMEQMGVVCRPAGERSGYATADDIPASQNRDQWSIARRLDALDVMLLAMCARAMTSVDIAGRCEIPRSTIGYRLRRLEGMNLVHRPHGVRSGYVRLASGDVLAMATALQVVGELTSTRVEIVREFLSIPRTMRLRSNYLAMCMEIPARTMRYHLNALDALGLVERRSNRKLGYAAVRPVADYAVQLWDEAV